MAYIVSIEQIFRLDHSRINHVCTKHDKVRPRSSFCCYRPLDKIAPRAY